MRALSIVLLVAWSSVWLASGAAWADPAKYPEFAAMASPHAVEPAYIHVDQLVDDVLARKPLMIVDVRTPAEYAAQHIKGAISVPLRDLAANLNLIPREGLVTLY